MNKLVATLCVSLYLALLFPALLFAFRTLSAQVIPVGRCWPPADRPPIVELVRGDTAQGGAKPATLETGHVVQVPLFVNEGDVLRIDTRTGSYVTRV